jgi:hypothetical protein
MPRGDDKALSATTPPSLSSVSYLDIQSKHRRIQGVHRQPMTNSKFEGTLDITPALIFSIHPRIRCVEYASEFGEPIFQKMREGTPSISPDELDDEFLTLAPRVITDFCKKYEPWYGSLTGLVVYHDNLSILIVEVMGGFLVVSFDRDTSPETIKRAGDEIYSKWGKRLGGGRGSAREPLGLVKDS